MFDDDRPVKKTFEFPRNLDGISVSDLEDYIIALGDEIVRVRADIERKRASATAADSFFKS